jgi:hypothetical protein
MHKQNIRAVVISKAMLITISHYACVYNKMHGSRNKLNIVNEINSLAHNLAAYFTKVCTQDVFKSLLLNAVREEGTKRALQKIIRHVIEVKDKVNLSLDLTKYHATHLTLIDLE